MEDINNKFSTQSSFTLQLISERLPTFDVTSVNILENAIILRAPHQMLTDMYKISLILLYKIWQDFKNSSLLIYQFLCKANFIKNISIKNNTGGLIFALNYNFEKLPNKKYVNNKFL